MPSPTSNSCPRTPGGLNTAMKAPAAAASSCGGSCASALKPCESRTGSHATTCCSAVLSGMQVSPSGANRSAEGHRAVQRSAPGPDVRFAGQGWHAAPPPGENEPASHCAQAAPAVPGGHGLQRAPLATSLSSTALQLRHTASAVALHGITVEKLKTMATVDAHTVQSLQMRGCVPLHGCSSNCPLPQVVHTAVTCI